MSNIESRVVPVPVNEIPMEIAEDPRSMAAFANEHIIGDPRVNPLTNPVSVAPHVQAIDARLATQIPPEGIKGSK